MRFLPFLKRCLAAGALALAAPSPAAVEDPGRLPLDELRTFADVYNQIRNGYVEEIDDSTLLEYAIQGMLMGLDPHSVYLTRDAFQDLRDNTSGEFTGLGLEVGMEDGYVTIIAPIDGSPAAAAGLQSGDVILKLGNVPVKGMSLGEAIEKMRGPKGSSIELTIGRPGESQPFEVTLVRDVIRVASVRQRWLEPGYGYIRIAQFQNATGDDVIRSLEKLMAEQELKGLVIWATEQYMSIAVETQSDIVFMLEHFCGHGWNHDNPAARCYLGPDTERWFDFTCIHPNPAGHAVLADMFEAVVNE